MLKFYISKSTNIWDSKFQKPVRALNFENNSRTATTSFVIHIFSPLSFSFPLWLSNLFTVNTFPFRKFIQMNEPLSEDDFENQCATQNTDTRRTRKISFRGSYIRDNFKLFLNTDVTTTHLRLQLWEGKNHGMFYCFTRFSSVTFARIRGLSLAYILLQHGTFCLYNLLLFTIT